MNNRQKYRVLCEQEPSIPLFSQAWWLDCIAEDSWDVVLVEKNDTIQASLPFVIRKKYGLTLITQPILTQNLGPWLRLNTAKYAKQLSQEKDLLQTLFSRLPPHTHYSQNWHCSRTNWLPLYWQGYQQTTCYTYRIEDLSNLDAVWGKFQQNIRTDVRKAKKLIKVRTDLPLQDFIKLNKKVFERQGMNFPYTEEQLIKIDQAVAKQNARKIFIAEDEQGQYHAGVYIVWDKEAAYYLMGGGDPDLRNSGATSLCIWEAIKYTVEELKLKNFDFEGSMLEPVERFFRAFGAKQTPYFAIRKTNSKLLKIYKLLQGILR